MRFAGAHRDLWAVARDGQRKMAMGYLDQAPDVSPHR